LVRPVARVLSGTFFCNDNRAGHNTNFMAISIVPWAVSLFSALLMLRADLRRRGTTAAIFRGLPFLATLDLAWPALLTGTACAAILTEARNGAVLMDSPLTWACATAAGITWFLWKEGLRQVQFQRPAGIVSGEALVLAGIYLLIQMAVFRAAPIVPNSVTTRGIGLAAVVAGGVLIGAIVPPFVKGFEGHRIIARLAQQGESVQEEYAPATPECPHPERWHMVDSQSSELEVLEFLKSVVTTVKPQLIVETGTFIGHSAIKMAEGLKANGFGRIITVEYDPAIFAKAKERIDASGIGEWIEYRNESSLETKIEGMIDIFFSDSHLSIRENEIRHFLPQIDPRGLILVHDASSQFRVVREAMLRLEQEGLISTVLLSTPRGVAVAQKREGRK
jgi:predicted O-methyltransferase YrrM